MEDNYKNNVEKNRFETLMRYSFKKSDKTQDIQTVITLNRYEVLSDSVESDTNGCNNENDKLSNNVTASISSQQVNLGNNDIKRDQYEHKSKTKKKKRVAVLQWLAVTLLLKKLKVGSYSPKIIYLL